MQKRVLGMLACWLMLALSCGAGAQIALVTNNLHGVAGNDVSTYTPALGGAWVSRTTVYNATGVAKFNSLGTGAYQSANSDSVYTSSVAYPTSTSLTVTARITQNTVVSGQTASLVIYGSTGKYYCLTFYNDGTMASGYYFQRLNSASPTGGTTNTNIVHETGIAYAYTTGAQHTFSMTRTTGGLFSFTVDGSAVAGLTSTTDNTFNVSGSSSLGIELNTNGSATTGLSIDNFTATYLANPAVAVNVTSAIAGNPTSITLTGTSTSWTSGTTFTTTNGTLGTPTINVGAQTATATWTPAAAVWPVLPISATFTSSTGETSPGVPVYSGQVIEAGNSLAIGADTSNHEATGAVVVPGNTGGIGTLLNSIGTGWYGINYGVGGWSTEQVASDWTTNNRDSLLNSHYVHNILIVFEGTNSIVNLVCTGSTDPNVVAANVYGVMSTFCAARKTAGWEVVAETVLPRDDTVISNYSMAAPAIFEAARIAYNKLVRAGYKTWANALSDPAADARIGFPGAYTNATYFHIDTMGGADTQVHLLDAGQVVRCAYDAQSIALIAQGGVGVGGTKRRVQ